MGSNNARVELIGQQSDPARVVINSEFLSAVNRDPSAIGGIQDINKLFTECPNGCRKERKDTCTWDCKGPEAISALVGNVARK